MKTKEQIEAYLSKLYIRLSEVTTQNERATERYLYSNINSQITVFEEVKSTQDRITDLCKRY